MTERPLLRKAYDKVERSVASRVEPKVQGPVVATGLALVKKVDTRVRRALEHRTAGLLHAFNLPAASDIRRLHEHLNAVEAHLTEVVAQPRSR